jgi:hypothetical protein
MMRKRNSKKRKEVVKAEEADVIKVREGGGMFGG